MSLTVAAGGPRRRTPRLLREVQDHLEDAATEGQDRGLARDRAELEAIRAFGTVEELAPAYRATLGFSRLRTTAIALMAVILMQPVAWGWWEQSSGDAAATGLVAALSNVPEYVGLAYLVLCPAVLAACGFLHRGRDVAAQLGLAIGGLVSLFACSVMLLALALNVLQTSVPGLLFTAAAVVLPMSAVLASTAQGLRLVVKSGDVGVCCTDR